MLFSIQSYVPFTLEHSSFCVDEAFSTLLGRGSPYCYPPSEGLGEVVCPNGCERPVPFCLTTSRRLPFVFSGRHGGCPYGWMHLFHPCPSFRMKNAVLCSQIAFPMHLKHTTKIRKNLETYKL